VSTDFRTWTVRIKPGVHFADDPAFRGAKRELVAEDFVYSIKRYADPALNSPLWTFIEQMDLTGLAALRKRATESKQAFDYDRPVAGLRALDRYTLQFQLDSPRPRLDQSLIGAMTNAVAREVVERYGDRIGEHPVGTGPYRLAQWRRSSLVVLERNPNYREARYHAEPAPNDVEGQAILQRLRGRRLPMVDRVEVSIIDAGQPRWLAFLDGSLDQIEVPDEFAAQAMPGGTLAPYLARRGVRGVVQLSQSVRYLYFNMEDALVGGYTPEKVALRVPSDWASTSNATSVCCGAGRRRSLSRQSPLI
jgi:ABC-type transport system substrate-binding protein